MWTSSMGGWRFGKFGRKEERNKKQIKKGQLEEASGSVDLGVPRALAARVSLCPVVCRSGVQESSFSHFKS